MNDLVDLLDLRPVLRRYALDDQPANFEDLFASLYESNPDAPAITEIEARIRGYFSGLELPDTATIYDRLILSLQPRDLVATFNWDPLLYLTYRRNVGLVRLPKLAALHGSVAIGLCGDHQTCGYLDGSCQECGTAFKPAQLLYPIRRKNYEANSFIAGEWDLLRRHLAKGYWITFFGYGAPATDVEAVSLLKDMAAANALRDIGDVEIIDIKSPEELRQTWGPFFVGGHYAIHGSFAHSILSAYPRRSAETLWKQSQLLIPVKRRPLPDTDDLLALQAAAKELMDEEIAGKSAG